MAVYFNRNKRMEKLEFTYQLKKFNSTEAWELGSKISVVVPLSCFPFHCSAVGAVRWLRLIPCFSLSFHYFLNSTWLIFSLPFFPNIVNIIMLHVISVRGL